MIQKANIPQTMSAVVLNGHGDLEKLEYHTEWPTPVPGPGEVLIKVHACGLNNTDVNTRTAWYSKSNRESTTGGTLQSAENADAAWGGTALNFPFIQGADVAGTVVAIGAGAAPDMIGRRVMVDVWLRDWDDPLNMKKCRYFGSECNGGFADFCTVDQRNVYPIDCDLSDAELATFATSYVTAENMLNRAEVTSDDVVLIPGASGGVGSALIQLAKRRGATTIAMASENKHEQLQILAPDAMLPRTVEDFPAALRDALGRETVTVVADVVGGADWPNLIEVLARGGRYTCSGAIAGPIVEFDLRTFYLNDLTFTGATVVPPGTFADLVGYIERGEIKPLLAESFPLRELRQSQSAFIEKNHIGNIVVTMA